MLQVSASGVQPRREGAAKTMGSGPTGGKTTTAISGLHCASHRTGGNWTSSLETMTDKQTVAIGRRPHRNIGPQCLREMRRKRQLPSPVCLGGWYRQNPVFPVDIGKPQPDDFDGAQAKVDHAQCHRMVAASTAGSSLKRSQKCTSLPAIENLRPNGLPEGSDMGNRSSKLRRASAPHLRKTQKATQNRESSVGRSWLEPTSAPLRIGPKILNAYLRPANPTVLESP